MSCLGSEETLQPIAVLTSNLLHLRHTPEIGHRCKPRVESLSFVATRAGVMLMPLDEDVD